MICPDCSAACAAGDIFCHRCGADLSIPSKSLVPVQSSRLPAVLHNPQLPRIAAGVGALAFGVGMELLRRGFIARLMRPSRSAARFLPALTPESAARELFKTSDRSKPAKLPRGYEIHETVVYMSRVIRRED